MNYRHFLAMALLFCIFTLSCQSSSPQGARPSLPQEAKKAFDHFVATRPDTSYRIVSAQKGTPARGLLSPDGDEVWCVVSAPPFDDGGVNVSHFLLTRTGLLWTALPMYDAEKNQFLIRNCDNW